MILKLPQLYNLDNNSVTSFCVTFLRLSLTYVYDEESTIKLFGFLMDSPEIKVSLFEPDSSDLSILCAPEVPDIQNIKLKKDVKVEIKLNRLAMKANMD